MQTNAKLCKCHQLYANQCKSMQNKVTDLPLIIFNTIHSNTIKISVNHDQSYE